MPSFSRLGFVAILFCVAAVAGIAYLHGFERAQPATGWVHRPALIAAYSREVFFRAGPCVLFAIATGLALMARARGLARATAAVAILGSTLAVVGTFLTIREYVNATPGQLMPTTDWDGVCVLLWLAAAIELLVVRSRTRK